MLRLFARQNGVLPAAGKPIGLLAGKGELPHLLAQAIIHKSHPLILASVEDSADEALIKQAQVHRAFAVKDAIACLKYLKQHQVKHMFLAGKIPKQRMYDSNFEGDALVKETLVKQKKQGDDHLMKAVLAILKINGIQVLNPADVLTDHVMTRGALGRVKLDAQQERDVLFGYKIAKEIGRLDIGQTVIVKQGAVLAVEAIEGTDQTIERIAQLGIERAVFVKCTKPQQELRLDMPVIGIQTIEKAKSARLAVIAAEAAHTLILQKEKVLERANAAGIAIYGI